MSASATTIPVALPRKDASSAIWLPAFSLWWREMIRFVRQPARVIGVLLPPLFFWLLMGFGFSTSFHQTGIGGEHFLQYFFPGMLLMIVLFASIFSMMSLIQDRNEGFLLSVMAAPISRSAIVLGKVLGGTTIAAIQGLLLLFVAPLIGIHLGFAQLAIVVAAIFMVSFLLTALGFAIAWPMDSPQAFHQIVNLFLLPMWLLSGSLFPVTGAASKLQYVMRANPLTYGVNAMLIAMSPASGNNASDALGLGTHPVLKSLGIVLAFCAVIFSVAFVIVNRRTTKPAA